MDVKSTPPEHHFDKSILLLTATIDPKNCSFVERKDPWLRLTDYISALQAWLSQPAISTVVFCENSGARLDQLIATAELYNRFNKNLVFVSYDAGGAGQRGKGYGELGIIDHAISACNLQDSAYVLKMTGRYYVRNIDVIVNECSLHERSDIVSLPFILPSWIASECFFSSVEFLRRFFIPKRDLINDSPKSCFEHFLACSVKEAAAAGMRHKTFVTQPQIEGLSGGTGVPWSETYMATAPIINPDCSVTIRDRTHMSIVAKFVDAFILLAGSELVPRPTYLRSQVLANRLRQDEKRGNVAVLSRADLEILPNVFRFCLDPKMIRCVETATGMNVRRCAGSLWCRALCCG